MRLAVLTSHPIQYYAPLFRYLARRIDLHVYFAHKPTPAEQSAAGFGTAFEWDVDLTSGYSHSFLKNVAKVPNVERFAGCDTPEIGDELRGGRFDAALSLGWHLKSLWQGIWAAKRLGLPVMVRGDSQLSSPRSPVKRAIKAAAYPVFLRTFDAALYVGERSRAYYTHYGYPAGRLFHSPHCVDTERFAAGASPQESAALRTAIGVSQEVILLLFAGRLVPFKRPLDLVRATSRLRASGKDAQVLVAGAGELEAELMDCALRENVPLHLLGFQNQSQMPRAYAAANAFVLPSTGRESWGLVCNEALACGTPIVVSDEIGGAPDLAADGRVGRTFRCGDVSACAEALANLISAPPSRGEVAEVSNRFSLAAAADGIVEAAEAVRRPTASHHERPGRG